MEARQLYVYQIAMTLSPQWLDELRARITLSSVIMRTTKLQRAGREWKACCPFHDEKTPSFTVNDAKGFYHCFGCQAHGDVIRWMTDQRGLTFMDAVKELAAQAGMELPAPDPVAARKAEQRASLHDVTAAAQDWFVDRLRSSDGAAARNYLASRGFSSRIINTFGFGYAPDSRTALKEALARFDDVMLVETGLRIAVDGKPPYDRFRGRLMLPIQDARGRVIGFGGRILRPRDGVAKYLNSPDTPLFDKGRTLYNLHRAAPAVRKADRLIVVEGYMDVIALAEAGIEEAVAPMGTALTEQQIELLWRQHKCPILCFDGDEAGSRAAMRAVERALPLLRPEHSLSVMRMPPGQDPDDMLCEQGRETFEKTLSDATTLLDTLWMFERDRSPLDTPEAKAGLKARLLGHADAVQHPDIRALYRRELLAKFSAFAFPPRPVGNRREWRKGRYDAPPARLSPESEARLRRIGSGVAQDELFAAVLYGLLRHPHEIHRHEDALLSYGARDTQSRRTVESFLDLAETLDSRVNLPISPPEGLPAPPDRNLFSFLMEATPPEIAVEDLAEAVSLLVERPALSRALEAATRRFATDPEGAFVEQQRLRERRSQFDERLRRIANRGASALPAK